MITLYLKRYYGTPNITKSKLVVENGEGKVLMECEAREGRYRDYDRKEKVAGSASSCIGRGEYQLVTDHCPGNPMCLRIYGDKRRRGFYIMVGDDEKEQFSLNRLQIGRGSLSEPMYRRICDFAAVKEEFQQMLYANCLEEFRLVVSNEEIHPSLPREGGSKTHPNPPIEGGSCHPDEGKK